MKNQFLSMTWRRVFELISWCGKGGVTMKLYTSIGCGCRNYCVINFVSHVEMVLIKIQSNNLNTPPGAANNMG